MSDKMRKEFDLWFAVNAPQCTALALSGDKVRIAMREMAWFSWQASRESLVVELPKPYSEHRMVSKPERHARSSTLSEVREAIESLGLRVKP